MSKKDEMKQIVKAAGECWHKYGALSLTNAHGLMCEHCSCITGVNPSPDDLNELVRLAEKLFTKGKMCINSINLAPIYDKCYLMIENPEWLSVDLYSVTGLGKTPADALRSALVKAIQ